MIQGLLLQQALFFTLYIPSAYYTAGGFFMINDIIIFALSLWGVIALLFLFIFKMIVWRLEELTFTLPLYKHDKEILNKVFNIRSFCEFCGLEKKSTAVLVNYGAPEWFCQEILEFYKNSNFVKIVSPEDTITELHT